MCLRARAKPRTPPREPGLKENGREWGGVVREKGGGASSPVPVCNPEGEAELETFRAGALQPEPGRCGS